jgi:hypothetical protein
MIEDTFFTLKSNLELTQTFQETISRSYNAVKSVIERNLPASRVIQIGSVGRMTRIQPKPAANTTFDIDMLVVLGEFGRWLPAGQGITKEIAMDSVQNAVEKAQRYSKKNPEQDHPTVTFAYENGVTIELVPAYVDNIGAMPNNGYEYTPKGRAFWVPSRTGWQIADYEYEASEITKANAACNGKLIPVIKMLKAAKREHFPTMKSFHLEVIAMNVVAGTIKEIEDRGLTATYPLIVAYVLFRLRHYVVRTWGIPGSLSPQFQIDAAAQAEFNGKADWIEAQMNAAVDAKTDREKHNVWKAIFNDWMPLS